MKRQWLGDDHDVRKYCLLRFLAKELKGINVAINWMISDDEHCGNDVRIISMEQDNGDYAKFASKIESYRREKDTREFMDMKNTELLDFKHTTFETLISEYRKKSPDERNGWLKSFLDDDEYVPANSLVFFDPNNGIQVRSMSPKTSVNYVLYNEIYRSLDNKKIVGVLIYQHARLYANGGTQEGDIWEKCEKIHTDLNQNYIPIVFLGGQKEEHGHFEEAYILLLKNDYKVEKTLFDNSFLKLINYESLRQ